AGPGNDPGIHVRALRPPCPRRGIERVHHRADHGAVLALRCVAGPGLSLAAVRAGGTARGDTVRSRGAPPGTLERGDPLGRGTAQGAAALSRSAMTAACAVLGHAPLRTFPA